MLRKYLNKYNKIRKAVNQSKVIIRIRIQSLEKDQKVKSEVKEISKGYLKEI